MKELSINFMLNLVVSWFIATLAFLIGKEIAVAAVATAAAAGVIGGIAVALSYMFGRMKEGAAWTPELWKPLVAMLISAVIGGVLGGVQMLWF